MALAYPEIHFRLQHDGRMVADYVAVSDGKDRLHQVLGGDVAKGLAPFRSRFGEISLHGYLSTAPVSYPNSRYLYTFVNKRFVRDKVLTHALLFGYESLLMKGQYPAVALFLHVPFADVDVNVHPAKHEIRFRRQSDIHQAVARAVREALKHEAKEPSPAGAGGEPPPVSGVAESILPYGAWNPLSRAEIRPVGSEIYPAATGPASPPSGYFSSLQVLGQVFGCYLVCSTADGLVLIDQHAAQHGDLGFDREGRLPIVSERGGRLGEDRRELFGGVQGRSFSGGSSVQRPSGQTREGAAASGLPSPGAGAVGRPRRHGSSPDSGAARRGDT